jgi:hypothetical protein
MEGSRDFNIRMNLLSRLWTFRLVGLAKQYTWTRVVKFEHELVFDESLTLKLIAA